MTIHIEEAELARLISEAVERAMLQAIATVKAENARSVDRMDQAVARVAQVVRESRDEPDEDDWWKK